MPFLPRLRSLLLHSVLFLDIVAADRAWTAGQKVVTSSGSVIGQASKSAPEVSEYLGIRFAKEPTGPLRFMAPQKYTSNETIKATAYAQSCPFTLNGFVLPPALSGGEDCLAMNVWTKPQTGEEKKAVMFWIYGGGFSEGNTQAYDGSNLANTHDVVVVSVGYRTNVFGFPGAPSLPDQNVAFLDQRLGVEWTRDNIAQFGGDPDRIIIWGESAGASSVDYYQAIWTEDPIIQGGISESGTTEISGPFAPFQDRAPSWFNLTKNLGCGGPEAGSEATVKCAQGKTVSQILNAMPKATGVSAIVGFYGPTYDDKYVFRDPGARAKAGLFIKKPYLVGSNNNESNLFQAMSGGLTPAQAEGIQNGFTCGAAIAGKARYQNKSPIWRFHYSGTAPGSTTGATHTDDLIPLWYQNGTSGLSKTFQDAWVAFAKDPVNGLKSAGIGWPEYVPGEDTLVRLGYAGAVKPDFVNSGLYDVNCTTFLAAYDAAGPPKNTTTSARLLAPSLHT